MNICLVSQEYPPETARGGIGTQTWNKAKSLSQLGHEVHVLTCAGAEGPDLRSESCSGVMVHRMQTPVQCAGLLARLLLGRASPNAQPDESGKIRCD
ncbi:MAG: hypothetical protein DMG58_18915 [Acidobacteria bacterium]|nr:MAG: hypothetical protein DMG58_18915 [Acidobacteriota bacterium]